MWNSGVSLADIAAVTDRDRNNGGFGGDWAVIILFFLFAALGGNGFGGFGGGNGGALTRGELCQDMNFADNANAVRGISTDLNAGFRTIDNAICTLGYQGAQLANATQMQIGSEFRGLDNAICTLGFNSQAGFNALANQLAQCCCEQKSEAAQTRFDMAHGFAQLDRTIADQFCALKMEQKDAQIADMQNQLNFANLAASQTAQNQYLIDTLRKCPEPAYIVPNPNCGCGNTYAYGGGCCGGNY